ncbi:hypothetical protein AC579_1619 [Pseudocercospora musae]|uniref:Uncharacterized protein n=1 Tax=Pseudocercospora musae TaxID=113226 RepID=A0A139HHR7_9PEZI|nr:hypothetical protein AC579_1619 [Pseudocercospora musae]
MSLGSDVGATSRKSDGHDGSARAACKRVVDYDCQHSIAVVAIERTTTFFIMNGWSTALESPVVGGDVFLPQPELLLQTAGTRPRPPQTLCLDVDICQDQIVILATATASPISSC